MQGAHHVIHLILPTPPPHKRRNSQPMGGGQQELNSVLLLFMPVCYPLLYASPHPHTCPNRVISKLVMTMCSVRILSKASMSIYHLREIALFLCNAYMYIYKIYIYTYIPVYAPNQIH